MILPGGKVRVTPHPLYRDSLTLKLQYQIFLKGFLKNDAGKSQRNKLFIEDLLIYSK